MAGVALGFLANLQDLALQSVGFHHVNLFGGRHVTGTNRRRALLLDVARDLGEYNRRLQNIPGLPPNYELVPVNQFRPAQARTAQGFVARPSYDHEVDANAVPRVRNAADLQNYNDNLEEFSFLFNISNTAARTHLINEHVINANIEDQIPGVSYLALYIMYKVQIIRQYMFLLSISDPNPLLGIHFDTWFRHVFTEDDFEVFGENDILTRPISALPHGNIINGLPTISNLIRSFQDPDVLTLIVFTVYKVAKSINSNVNVTVILRLLTKRRKLGESEPSVYKYLGLNPDGGTAFNIGGATGATLEDIRYQIIKVLYSKFYDHSGSEFIFEEDQVTVLGINFLFEVFTLPNPLHQLPTPVNGSNVQVTIRRMLQRLTAFRIPKELYYKLDKLTKKFPSRFSNDCLVEAFVFMRLYQMEKITDAMSKKEQLQVYVEEVAEWPLHEIQGLNIYEAIKLLLYAETTLWERHDQSGYLILNFFGGFGRPPPCRSVQITLVECETDENSSTPGYELEYEFPEGEDVIFKNEASMLELVYYQGHMMVCQHGQFEQNVYMGSSYIKRMMKMTDTNTPEPFVLKPIDATKLLRKRKETGFVSANPLAKIEGCYCPDTEQCKTSADLETGTCDECSAREGRCVQEAFSCGLAWGTKREESICFNGQECLEKAKSSTFETFDGCITQMIRWMKLNWGFFHQDSAAHHAPCKIIERVVYWFYVSRFDMFFLKDVLLFWNEPVELMPINGDLLKIKWGQYSFVDFARLYTGFNLDKCYETFKQIDVSRYPYLQHKPQSKWKAFPYMAIRSGMFDRGVMPIRFMRENNEVWGEKKANPKDERSIGEVNAEWWEREISSEGFDVHQHLADYCISDVLILQFCVCVHSWIIAVGEMEACGVTRKFDLNQAITCSNMAMTLFRQVFLPFEITSPLTTICINHVDAISGQKLSLQSCFQDAMKGGKTDCFRHSMYNPTREESVRRWMDENPGKAPTIDDYDVNSMYPHIMESSLMPTEFEEIEEFNMTDGMNVSADYAREEMVDHYLYWSQIYYPPGKSGILSKVHGFCVSLQKLEWCYEDPHRKDRMTYTMIYGRELKLAKKLYPEMSIRVRLVIKFSGTALFKEYINTLYQKRISTDSKLFKTFYKLMMNSTYGKLAQGLKPQNTLIYNNFDLLMTEEDRYIVDVQSLPGPRGEPIHMVSTVQPEKSYIGQFIYMAAYITAGARSVLEELMFDACKCTNLQGNPCLVYYVDTDSIKICSFAAIPENQWFIDKWVHSTTLGKIKSEGRYDWLVMLGKKCGFFHEVEEDNQICSKEKLMESLQGSGLKSWHVKSKGLPSKIVDPKEMMDIYLTGNKHTFGLPDQLRRALKNGITRTTGATRSMGFRNLARRPPSADGTLEPYETAQEFIAVMKDRGPRQVLKGLIHLD